jgi:hypothetical protein
MSGHWRFCVAAFLLLAGLSASPAFSNPLTDLFNPTPKEATAPAPAREECVPQPGKSTALGQHWVYRLDGHRKCWFQADAATVSVKKQARHHAAKQPVIAPEENGAALRQQTVLDARAQLLSAAPADALKPTAPVPEVVDTASAPANGAATLVPAAPIPAQPTIDQLTPDHPAPRSVDVEVLLAASSLDTAASSVPPAAPIPDSDENHWKLMATPAGVALIALGLVLLAGSLLASRFSDPGAAPSRRAGLMVD